MAGIPIDGTNENGNPILPGVPVDGTGAEADTSTKDGVTHATNAGDFGALGAQVSNYSNLTEGYVRDMLGAAVGASDAWMNAWQGLCDLIAQFPFVKEIMALAGGVGNGIQQLLGGIQYLADQLCGLLTCSVPYTATITNMVATGTRITFTINTANGHALPDNFASGSSFTVSGLEDAYNGAFKVTSVTRGASTSTVIAQSGANAKTASVNGTLSVSTTPQGLIAGIQAVLAGILANPLVSGFLTWINEIGTGTGHIILQILDGVGHFLESICALLTTGRLPGPDNPAWPSYGNWTVNPIGTVLTDIQNIFNALCSNPLIAGLRLFIADGVAATGRVVEDAIHGALNLLTTLTNMLGLTPGNVQNVVKFFVDQIQFWLNCIWGWVSGTANAVGGTVKGILDGIGTLINNFLGIFGINAATIPAAIAQLGTWVSCIWNALSGAVGQTGKTITEVFSALETLLNNLFAPFTEATLPGLVNLATSLIGLLGHTLGNGISQVIQWFETAINWIWNAFSFFLGGPTNQSGKTIMDIITLFTDWIWRMSSGLLGGVGTLIQNIVAAITGFGIDFLGDPLKTLGEFFSGLSNGANTLLHNILEGVAGALGQTVSTLYSWATNLVSIFNIPTILQNLWGWFIAHIPVANIGASTTPVNMLTLGTFETAATLQADSGWSWDSSNDRGGVVGGAAKLDCSVGTGWRFLFSNQNVTVAPGDKISASAYIKTGLDRNLIGFTGSSSSVALLIIPFVKSTAQDPVVVATRGGSSGWVSFNGDATAYTIAQTNNPLTQVTSIKMCLAAAPSATSGSIWWDDIQMYKTGFMQQGLVDALPQAFGGLIDGLSGSLSGTTSSATGSASNMYVAATNPAGAAAVAKTKAVAAAQSSQDLTNGIATTVGGQPAGTDYAATTASAHFGSFFTKLYGAGNTTPQSTVPQASLRDIPQSFAGLTDALRGNPQGTTYSTTGDYNNFFTATTATSGPIKTAVSNAGSALDKTQFAANALATTVGGQPAGPNYATDQASLQAHFGSFMGKLYGAGNTTPQDTIANTALPSGVKYSVGSGAIVKKTNAGTISIAPGKQKLGGIGVWDYRDPNTSDIKARPAVDGGTFNHMQVVNAGWYQAEINYRLNTINGWYSWNHSWNIAATIWAGQWSTGMSEIAVGQDSMIFCTNDGGLSLTGAYSWGQTYCHGSFIIYLDAGWYVAPGYDLRSPASGYKDYLKSDGSGTDFYFSLALLNRSLA